MLIVRPIQNKELQKNLCEKAGIGFEAEAMAYLAAESDDLGVTLREFLGVLQFDLDAKGARLYPTAQMPGVQDEEAMIIMGRAAMSFMHRSGANSLRADASVCDEKLLSAFGLLPDGKGGYEVDLELFFKSPCSYNKEHGTIK